MTTTTTAPVPAPVPKMVPLEDVADLLPAAAAYAELRREIPSQNTIQDVLHVGIEKARTIRWWLIERDATAPRSPGAPDAGFDTASYPQITPRPATMTGPLPDRSAERGAESTKAAKRPGVWPLVLLVLPAFVSLWSGWVGLGELTGFGVVHPLPGILPNFSLNTAITLPIGVEAYAGYAMRIWLSAAVSARTRLYAGWSVLGAFIVGAAGQIAYHLMTASGMTKAPWQITICVAVLPLLVAFAGGLLAHLVRTAAPTTDVPATEPA